MLAVVQNIASFSSEVKPFASCPSSFVHWVKLNGTQKNPHYCSKTSGKVFPGGCSLPHSTDIYIFISWAGRVTVSS